MIEKQFFFMSGVPRSGSTLLGSILNQNKSLYSTYTSPLLDLLYLNEQEWRNNPSVIANTIPNQLNNISEAIINGCWQHIEQNIIIDKHRAWGRNLPAIQKIFGIKPKVIITVRDIPSIIASFIRLLRESKQNPTYIDAILKERGKFLTDANRVELLWKEYIFDTWDSFKTAFEFDKSSLLLIDYDELIINPDLQIKKIYDFLELPHFKHDYNNIINLDADDDLVAWGLEGLHTIRKNLEKTSKHPSEILGDSIYNKYKNMNLEFWK